MKKKHFNKFKQAGRREARRVLNSQAYEMFITKALKPKPRFLPMFLYVKLLQTFLKTKSEYEAEYPAT